MFKDKFWTTVVSLNSKFFPRTKNEQKVWGDGVDIKERKIQSSVAKNV